MWKKIAVLGLLVGMLACAPTTKQKMMAPTIGAIPQKIMAKNIILMIGDGMGLSQITAGMYANNNRLNLEQFPIVGLQKTHSYNHLVTDSAAGATAIACGVKTYNAAIGVDKDTLPVQSILEEASEKGLKTGLIATSTIVHATPAAFIAHRPLRNMYEYIANDILESDIDLFIGGGLKYFNQQRMNEKSLLPKLKEKGFLISGIANTDLIDLYLADTRKLAYFTSNDTPIPAASGRDYLPIAGEIAANFLNRGNRKGFFLMIEGSQIDWGGHANDAKYIISEVKDFDETVGKILDFAKKDKETLVIVTADHETGGFAINPKSKMNEINGSFTDSYHTASMVPVFAYGPGSELFSGIYENIEIHAKMRTALGFDEVETSTKSSN